MYSATAVEPTKLTACTRSSVSRVSTASLSPLTRLNTPSGSPASVNSRAQSNGAVGSFSEGFNTKVLPQAIAIGYIHIGTIAGKLNGVMPATTPSGWCSAQLSMPGPTFLENSPFSSSAMPQAYSTTSTPRRNSPIASSSTLPCSSVMAATTSSAFSSSNCLKRNMMRARLIGGMSRHAGKAASAAAMASSTVCRDAMATCRATLPVAGFVTGSGRLASATSWPLMK